MKNTIVFLHNHFLKPGGASKVVLEQASGLAAMGMNCIVITSKVNPEVIKQYNNIKIIEINNFGSGNLFFWITFPIFFLKLKNTIKAIDPEFIYCHSLAIYWGYFYKKLNHKIKLVYYMHDLGLPYTDLKIEIDSLEFFLKYFLKIISPLLSTLNTNIFSTANYIIANSQTSANYLQKKYKRTVDIIIWPGVEINKFKSNIKRGDYIFTVGRMEKSKNIDKIIQAFILYRLKRPKSKIKLLIVGTGVEKKHLVNLIEKNRVTEFVHFKGEINNKEVYKIAIQAKLGIFLGPYETFGIAAAESLSCGTPVVGINTGGIREILAKNNVGILVDENPESAAKAITKMLDNPKVLAKMSKNAIRFSKEKLSLNLQTVKLYNFFKSLQSN